MENVIVIAITAGVWVVVVILVLLLRTQQQKNAQLLKAWQSAKNECLQNAQGLQKKQAELASVEKELKRFRRVKARTVDPSVHSYEIEYECRQCGEVNLVNMTEEQLEYVLENRNG